jgi:hypothetical protein
MSLFGLGSSSKKSHEWIDPRTSAAQWDNYQGAQQGLLGSYTPTSGAQIQTYMNPYLDNVVRTSLGALDHTRQMAINDVADRAQSAHAFGGSRHGVAEGITNDGFGNQAATLSANLYNSGYGQALSAAQDENRYGYAYPISRQNALNSTLAGITPETFGKYKSQDPAAAFSNFGKVLQTGGDIAKLIASFG